MSQYYYAVGRRKTSVATVRFYPTGDGSVEINGKPASEYFTVPVQKGTILDPIKTAGVPKTYKITIKVEGGGNTGQAEAIRLGIAKAIVVMNKELRPELKKAGYLSRDSRKVERKKAGFKKARRSPQWSKR